MAKRNQMLGKLMLVVSEVAEAAEAVRANNLPYFEEEIADTLIRLFDICGTMEIDISRVIAKKMEINKARQTRHGKHTSL
jgi:NTP pyrophosphatase (non-canonical NTP hydrolase)